MSPENSQLQKLLNQGLTIEQASEALGLSVEASSLALSSAKEEVVSVEELVARYKPKAIEVLANVMLYGENESAKVKAAQIIYEGKGQLPEMQASKIQKMLNDMMVIAAENRAKIIDIKASTVKETPSTVTGDTHLEMAGAI